MILVKMSAGGNYTNMLCSIFMYQSALRSFSFITAWLCDFFAKNKISVKDASKMLVRLATDVYFTNNLCVNFLYKSALRSFSRVTFCLGHFLVQKYWCKRCL